MTRVPTTRIAFLYATVLEAAPLIEALGARAIPDCEHAMYRIPDDRLAAPALIAITGMGPERAARATREVVTAWRPHVVVNAGIAGALREGYAVGDVVPITGAAEIDLEARYVTGFQPLSSLHVQAAPRARPGHLVSRAEPVFDPALRRALGASADLVDMEGAAIARVCRAAGVSCALLKAVSDHADDRATLLRNLDFASRRLADFVLQHHRRPQGQEAMYE